MPRRLTLRPSAARNAPDAEPRLQRPPSALREAPNCSCGGRHETAWLPRLFTTGAICPCQKAVLLPWPDHDPWLYCPACDYLALQPTTIPSHNHDEEQRTRTKDGPILTPFGPVHLRSQPVPISEYTSEGGV